MITPILRWFSALLVLAAAGTLVACGGQKAADNGAAGPVSGKITVDGSDTVFPITKAMAAAFRASNPAVQIDVEFSGTGGGFKKFCAGQIDIEDASRPIRSDEGEQCKAQHIEYIELPVAFDPLSVVVNAKNTFVDCLTIVDLKAMWEPAAEGKTMQWNQIRESFPALPLVLFGPGKASGTFDYFTFAIVGTEGSSRGDYTKSEDDMVIERGVAAEPNALGYFGYAYYQANKDQLKVVAVDNGSGCILPSAKTVADETYQPLSRPLFIYIKAAAAARPEVRAFTRFYLARESTKIVTKVGYVPLPKSALVAQVSRFEKCETGSAFGAHGSVTGAKLDPFEEEEKERERNKNRVVSD
jgi:phosphate transport system substrate-binding protein